MVRRISAALALALVVAVVPGGAGLSQTVPSSAPPTKPEPDPNVSLQQPIVFYLARGEPDACGRGCSEWIAAEGKIDPGAAARLRAFLAKTRATRLPIYIHSPGGLTLRAFEMGRFIRERGMTIGVSKTAPEECKAIDEKGCSALKRSGKTLTAELTPLGVCASACVYFLAAGKVRQVPPGAKVGVHRGQMVRLYADGHVTVAPQASQAKVSASDPGLRKYLNEMGVDSRLTEIASKIPHEKIYFLSRDEIAAVAEHEHLGQVDAARLSEWLMTHRGGGHRVVAADGDDVLPHEHDEGDPVAAHHPQGQAVDDRPVAVGFRDVAGLDQRDPLAGLDQHDAAQDEQHRQRESRSRREQYRQDQREHHHDDAADDDPLRLQGALLAVPGAEGEGVGVVDAVAPHES